MELVRQHPLVEIRGEDELDRATEMIHSLAGRYDADTDAYRKTLAILIERYEAEHYPMGDAADPAGMLRFLLESKGVNQAQVVAETGLAPSTLSEILSGKRGISAKARPVLAEYFGVDPGVFV